jgi:hypothetical protein
MKKVLLLLWKVLLTSFGCSEKLQLYFCVQFPMKKVLLLLWKVVLFLCSVSHEESAAAAVESTAYQSGW